MSTGRPGPWSATTAAEFLDALHQLRGWAGQPSLRTLTRLAGKATVDDRPFADRLPVSTLSDNLAGKRLPNLPRESFVIAYVQACLRAPGLDERDISSEVEQWRKALHTLSAALANPTSSSSRPPTTAAGVRPLAVLRERLATIRCAYAVRRLAIVVALALLAIVAVSPSRIATTIAVDTTMPPGPYVTGKPPATVTHPAGPTRHHPANPYRPVTFDATPAAASVTHSQRAQPSSTPPRKATPPPSPPDYSQQYQEFSQASSKKFHTVITQQQQAYDPGNSTPWKP